MIKFQLKHNNTVIHFCKYATGAVVLQFVQSQIPFTS